MTPDVSVVIPTHNRLPYLRQCLAALATQTFPAERMEVIVVADGCTDGTEAALSEAAYPFELRVLAQPASGAAAARNSGARAALGRLLLFVDDDVVGSPTLVAAHTAVHVAEEARVAVGPYIPDQPSEGDFYAQGNYQWWTNEFRYIQNSGPRLKYRSILTGNLSLPPETFHQVGGFDAEFSRYGSEDYELGLRLEKLGLGFTFVPDAFSRHLDTADLPRSLRRARHEGFSEVLLARKHPHVFPSLRLARLDSRTRNFVFEQPRYGRIRAGLDRALVEVAQALRLYEVWKRAYGRVLRYWYWRGVLDQLPTAQKRDVFFREVGSSSEVQASG